VALAKVGGLDIGVGREEAGDLGVVDAAIHFNDAKLVQHLMPGEASVQEELGGAASL